MLSQLLAATTTITLAHTSTVSSTADRTGDTNGTELQSESEPNGRTAESVRAKSESHRCCSCQWVEVRLTRWRMRLEPLLTRPCSVLPPTSSINYCPVWPTHWSIVIVTIIVNKKELICSVVMFWKFRWWWKFFPSLHSHIPVPICGLTKHNILCVPSILKPSVYCCKKALCVSVTVFSCGFVLWYW